MSNKQRVRYIEFMGTPNGAAGIIVFSDQHKQIMGSYPLKRFGLQTLHDQIGKWLNETDPVNILKELEEIEEIEIKPDV